MIEEKNERKFTRRDFIKLAGGSALALGLGLITYSLSTPKKLYASSRPKTTIELGWAGMLSGLWARLGEEFKRGTEIAVEECNEQGGILGRPVKVHYADTPNIDTARSEALRFVETLDLPVLFGMWCAGAGMAVATICERKKRIFFPDGPIQGWELMTQGLQYTFRPQVPTGVEGMDAVDWLVDEILPKMGWSPSDLRCLRLSVDAPAFLDMSTGFMEQAKKSNIQVLAHEVIDPEIKDFSGIIGKIKALDINFVGHAIADVPSKRFWTQMRELNVNVPLAIGCGGDIGGGMFIDALGKGWVNGFMATNWAPEKSPPTVAPEAEKFREKYEKKYGDKHIWSCHSLSMYTSTKILFEVLKNSEDHTDPEAIRESMLKTNIPKYQIGNGWGWRASTPDNPHPYKNMIHQNLRSFCVGTQWQDNELWTVWPSAFPGKETKVPIPTWNEKGKEM